MCVAEWQIGTSRFSHSVALGTRDREGKSAWTHAFERGKTDLVSLLEKAGAQVHAFDPLKPGFAINGKPTEMTLQAAIEKAEILLLLVNHTEFRNLDPKEIRGETSALLALDTVAGWKETDWTAEGFRFYRLGRGFSY